MPQIRLMLQQRVGPEQETKFGESATVCAPYAVTAPREVFTLWSSYFKSAAGL
jgi:Mlc titration factor MtfA (ptsG expression regulator)